MKDPEQQPCASLDASASDTLPAPHWDSENVSRHHQMSGGGGDWGTKSLPFEKHSF